MIFSALVAAELSNTTLTIPPIWDDSIAVSDRDLDNGSDKRIGEMGQEHEKTGLGYRTDLDLKECSKIQQGD